MMVISPWRNLTTKQKKHPFCLVRLEVPMEAILKWLSSSFEVWCSLVDSYRHFIGSCYHHHQEGSTESWNYGKFLPGGTALRTRRELSSSILLATPQQSRNLFCLCLCIYIYIYIYIYTYIYIRQNCRYGLLVRYVFFIIQQGKRKR
jgi:hypothetical protein